MKYIHGTTEFHIEEECVLSLGKFDGLLRFRRLLGLRVIGGVSLGRVIGLAAAGGEGQGQRQGQQSGKNLVFHVLFLQ